MCVCARAQCVSCAFRHSDSHQSYAPGPGTWNVYAHYCRPARQVREKCVRDCSRVCLCVSVCVRLPSALSRAACPAGRTHNFGLYSNAFGVCNYNQKNNTDLNNKLHISFTTHALSYLHNVCWYCVNAQHTHLPFPHPNVRMPPNFRVLLRSRITNCAR